jgi:hypothetical protein
MIEANEPVEPPVNDTSRAQDTGIQANAPALQAVEAPAQAAPPPSPKKARQLWLTPWSVDRALVALLLVLTFFLGSFAARNADFLMELATGRLIAHGEYRFGVDPYAYGTEGAVWVNHSWLFDWLIYTLWSTVGDAGPIVFKAVLMTALALLLLGIRRPGQSVSLPVLCIGLAMLAASPRMLMQSTCISFLFLGITLYVLMRSRRIWLLPVLFIFWVNLDGWFVLGPTILACYVIGSVAQRLAGQTPDYPPAKVGLVFVAGVAACLVNPHHYRAFMLPAEWAYLAVQAGGVLPSWTVAGGETIQSLIQGEQALPRSHQSLRLLWLSPLTESWRSQPNLGYNIAGFSYFVLLLLGLVSFAVPAVRNARVFPWCRFLIWLVLGFLSLGLARLIPFFAIAAGPVTALNFQEYLKEPAAGGGKGSSVLGRLAAAALFLALLFMAWPGWLHSRIFPFDFRALHRVAWKIDFDPSLRDAALRLSELQKKGVLRHGFGFSPDISCYCAWFTPEVKGFIDYRYSLFPDRAKEYARSRLALVSRAFQNLADAHGPLAEWRQLTTQFDINYVVLSNFASPAVQTTRIAAGLCWLEPARWPWLFGDGRTLVFGWNDVPAEGPLSHEALALDDLAFGKVAARDRAPGAGAPLPGDEASFWQNYLSGTPAPSVSLDAAEQFQLYDLFYSDHLKQTYQRVSLGMFLHAPVALSMSAPAGITFVGTLQAHMLQQLQIRRMLSGGVPLFGRPAVPVLAMRHVRRALAASPLEAAGYETLAKVIDLQRRQERSRAVSPEPTMLQQIRQFQLIAAWKNYLLLKPDDPRAHELMARFYFGELKYLDVGLEHLRLALEFWDRQPHPVLPQARQELDAERQRLETSFQQIEKEVKRRQAEFDLRASGMPALQQVALALGPRPGQGPGLARRALQALQQAKPNQPESLALLFHHAQLLLLLGEVREVNENLTALKGLGISRYLQFQIFCASVAGDYDRADAAIGDYLTLLAVEKRLPGLVRDEIQQLVPAPVACARLFDRQLAIVGFLQQGAEWYLVKGILALERGDTALAATSFQKVIDFVGTRIPFPERRVAEHYLKLIQDNR